jgi:hypothetical protein
MDYRFRAKVLRPTNSHKETNMSVLLCERCGDHIDSDDDPDCFCEQPFGEDAVHCQGCRDHAAEAMEHLTAIGKS